MVHIEVFLGGASGEKSIGSRTCINEVSYHDSYKFVSTSYHSIKYHYRSIETWLDGICRSYCPQHKWKAARYAVSEGNNHQLITNLLFKRGCEEIGKGMRNTDKVRIRWTHKPAEINFRQFVEGKHLVNHLSNSSILTNKFKLIDLIEKLKKSMLVGAI